MAHNICYPYFVFERVEHVLYETNIVVYHLHVLKGHFV